MRWRGPLPPDDAIFHRGIISVFRSGPLPAKEAAPEPEEAPDDPEPEQEEDEG
jgi:hypothetical protein